MQSLVISRIIRPRVWILFIVVSTFKIYDHILATVFAMMSISGGIWDN
jgi:hypothetical protein